MNSEDKALVLLMMHTKTGQSRPLAHEKSTGTSHDRQSNLQQGRQGLDSRVAFHPLRASLGISQCVYYSTTHEFTVEETVPKQERVQPHQAIGPLQPFACVNVKDFSILCYFLCSHRNRHFFKLLNHTLEWNNVSFLRPFQTERR